MRFYNIKDEYIHFLKQYDNTVANNKDESRPYIGTVIEVNEHKYYAPFTSPKPKHKKMKNTLDFRKIDNGNLGAINLNNMIPVIDNALIPIDFKTITDSNYKRLLQKQYIAINKDKTNIIAAAKKLHELIFTSPDLTTPSQQKIINRCCNLPLLEKICNIYTGN